MRVTLRRGRPHSQDRAPGFSGAQVSAEPPVQGGDTEALTTNYSRGHDLSARALTVLFVVAMACGPVALAWQLFTPTQAPVVAEQSGFDQRMASRRDVAAEVAAQWVSVWLASSTGDEARLARYWPGQVSLPRQAPTVSAVRPIDAVAAAPGVWSVTVAATVTPAEGGPRQRFFQVPVRVEGEAGTVSGAPMALPAVVHGPEVVGSAGSGSYPVPVNISGPLGSTVSAFVRAYLTGDEDPVRYLTPSADIPALGENQRFADVRVSSVNAAAAAAGTSDQGLPEDGVQVHVQAEVQLFEEAEQGAALSASYPLLLTARGGRWEVTAIDRALIESTQTGTGGPAQSTDDETSSGQ